MNFRELSETIEKETVQNVMERRSKLPYSFPKFDIVEQKSGYDEGDESLEAILFFGEEDIYVKVTGSYSSYGDGSQWNNTVTQVYAHQKTVTVFTESQYENQ